MSECINLRIRAGWEVGVRLVFFRCHDKQRLGGGIRADRRMQMVFQHPLGSGNGRRERGEDFNLGKAEGCLVADWGGETTGLRDVSRSDRVVSRLSAGTLSWESGPLFAINKTLREISHMWEPGCFLLKMSESSFFKKWSPSSTSCRWSTFHSITPSPPPSAPDSNSLHFTNIPSAFRVEYFVKCEWHTYCCVLFCHPHSVSGPPVLKLFLFLLQVCPDWWFHPCKLHSLPL